MSSWNKDEWKERSDAFKEGKVCEWCSAKTGDEYATGKGKTKKKYLTVHHRNPPKLGRQAYRKIANKFHREYFANNQEELKERLKELAGLREQAVKDLGPHIEEKDLKKRIRYIFDGAHRAEIDELYEEYKRQAELEYMTLTPETAMVLCNRCHTARRYGKVLCQKCKEHYHNPKYPMCYHCNKKKDQSNP